VLDIGKAGRSWYGTLGLVSGAWRAISTLVLVNAWVVGARV